MSNTVNRSDVGFRSERGPILIALMLTTGLVAIDSTILATAVSSIVDDLGSFSLFPWLFSIYLLAQAVSVPIYAKLSDMVGRKPIVLIGIGLFLLGSILCGFAWSRPALIAFRVIQGLGAGAVQPMSVTIAGDIYTVAERAKTQGYLASVWAISSVVGPTLGGVFSQFLSWRWIFFVNMRRITSPTSLFSSSVKTFLDMMLFTFVFSCSLPTRSLKLNPVAFFSISSFDLPSLRSLSRVAGTM